MQKLKHTNLYNALFNEIISLYESEYNTEDIYYNDNELCILFKAMQDMLQTELSQYDLNKYDCWNSVVLNYDTFEQFYISEINL